MAATPAATDEAQPTLSASADLCETLFARYAKSPAPQHRHLVAAAAAMRSILLDESLPLIPAAYFAAAVSTIQNAGDGGGDPAAISALVSFLSVVLPVVPRPALTLEKASEAAGVLNGVLRSGGDGLPASTLQSLVKSVGALVKVGNLEDWGVVKSPLKTLLSFSTDKRPKVRKVAQLGMEELFRSIQDSTVRQKSSKRILHFFDEFMPKAIELAAVVLEGDADVDTLSKSDHVEVFHMLNTIKLVSPFLSDKIQCKLLSRLNKLLSSPHTPVTRHAFSVLEMLCESLEVESSLPGLEELVTILTSFISSCKKVPQDSILCAVKLLKCVLRKVHLLGRSLWFRNLWHALDAVAGQLNGGTDVAEQASDILVEIVDSIDINAISKAATHSSSFSESCPEWKVVEIICFRMDNILDKADAILGKHVLAVISHLFLRLGGTSYLLMREIFIKLSIRETSAKEGMPDAIRECLHDCVGSAIAAMGPEEILGLIPITFHPDELTLSNSWLIPLLRKYVRGASLKYFMYHIVPLANSIKEASVKVKKPHVLHNLQSSYDGLWALLPAFCRYPTDVCQSFEAFARFIVSVLKKTTLLCATISMGLLELVNQNKRILNGNISEGDAIPSFYSKKVASRNIKTIAVNSVCLLKILRDIMFDSTLEDRGYLKEAIGNLASITDSSKVKKFFISSLKKFELEDFIIESEKFSSPVCKSSEKECGHEKSNKTKEVTHQRCILLEFVSSLVVGADEALVNMLFDYVKAIVWAADNVGQVEAYFALGRIFQEHPWFYSSRFDELMTLLLDVKPTDDIISLKNRLSCFRFLLVHILKGNAEDTSEKAFLILNEIILTVKSVKHDAREAAYDSLRMAVSDLKGSKHEDSEECIQRLFSMILAYLSGSSPHIMSGAVSALSLLIYNDPGLCFAIPDLIPSVFILLKSKALEVVKAVMGFMKVLVSCLPVKDLQKYLAEIINEVLPWSDISKNHIRAKVRIIMEITIRKCGLKVVELIAPEKHRGFIRTVVEKRQSSNGLKGVDTSELTSKPVESSAKWENKGKRVQMASNNGNNSKVPSIVGMYKKRNLPEGSVSDTSKRKKSKFTGKNGIERGEDGIKGKKSGSSNKMANGGKVDDRRKHHLKRHANFGRPAGSAKPHKYNFGKPRKSSKVQLRKT